MLRRSNITPYIAISLRSYSFYRTCISGIYNGILQNIYVVLSVIAALFFFIFFFGVRLYVPVNNFSVMAALLCSYDIFTYLVSGFRAI